jgi:hypothetical protein
MPRNITLKKLRILTAVCAFNLSFAQMKAEDQFLVDEGKAYAEIIISESGHTRICLGLSNFGELTLKLDVDP